ncbi:hypothetical protein QO259_14705 [Salinicola sp. JS01]|uniref:hypothetical protein n=1 Tax=Salinicola sp. JS01 TaxID=3050071 RepID=UPI00255BBA01|nr:hypothetical protein [Salinicola sp. JS01]WIX32048.1 hypothetical protein QO259_14705 [Salinicola sp. JS01]
MQRSLVFASRQRLATLAIAATLAATLGGGVSSVFAADAGAAPQPESERVLSGDQIQQRVWGHRVHGAMANGQSYDETYATDGKIQGDGYTGQARIVDDRMCFDYGSDSVECYGVRAAGDDRIEWLQQGEVAGEGVIEAPNQ